MNTNNYVQITVLNRAFIPLTTFSGAYDDLHTQQLGGAGTFTFNLDKTDDAVEYLETGNYLVFTDEKDRPQIFTIMNTEEQHDSTIVSSYEGGIELINKNVEAYTADSAYSFAYYFDKFFKDTPWEIGVNEISGLSRKLEWTADDTGLGRFLSLLTEFDNAEFKFDVQFEQMRPTKFIVNIYKQIGSYKPEIQAVYGDKLNDISFKKSRSEFVTAIKGVGGTPQADTTETTNTTTEQPPINFADLEYDDGFFRTTKGDPFLYAYKANAHFNPNTADSYIETSYSYDTLSAQELLNRTLTRIKKYSEIQYEITADVKVIDPDIELGDTVTLIDPSYKPALYLEARVSELKKSYTDMSKGSITYTNYKLMTQADNLKIIQSQIPSLTQISNVVTNVIEGSESIKNTILALTSADGRSTVYYDAKPSNAKEGDTAFVKNPDSGNMEIWNYVGGQWTLTAGDATFDDLKTQIDKAQTDAQTATTTANNAVSNANKAVSTAGFANDTADQAKTAAANAQTEASSAFTKADSAVASALDAQSDASDAVKQASSAASDSKDAQQIAGAVSQSYKTLTDGSTMTIAELEGGLAAKLTKTDLDGYSTQTWTQNQIKMTADGITESVQNMTSDMATQTWTQGQLKLTADGFTSQISSVKTDLTNLAIGGRNYFSVSGFSDNKYTGQRTVGYYDIQLLPNTKYTVSTNNAGIIDQGYANVFVGNKGFTPDSGSNGVIVNKPRTVTTDSTGVLTVAARNYSLDDGQDKIQVELGAVATLWQPAPEDMATVTQFTSIEQTLEGVKSTANDAATQSQYTQLAGQVTSVVSTANGNSSQITQLSKDINLRVTADQVDASILADKTVKDNRDDNQPPSWYYANYPKQNIEELKQTSTIGLADGSYAQLTSEIAWHDTSVPIKQTARTNTQTSQRFSTSETTWSSWSTIADTSNVISQINISPESILIAGQKVHITGQTTIDSGIITSAMIGDAVIDSGKIKDEAVTNSKIANLDGGKITANSITADKLAVNTLLVGINEALGTGVSLDKNGLSVVLNGNYKAGLSSSGLVFGDSSHPDGIGSIMMSSYSGINGLLIQGDLLLTDNIYGRGSVGNTDWINGGRVHFERLTIDGKSGIAIINDLETGIFFSNNGSLWLANSGQWTKERG